MNWLRKRAEENKMADFYDRVHRVPVWVVIDLGSKKSAELTEQLVENDGAFFQPWPARSLIDTVKELGRKGWNHVVSQKYPFTVDVNFVAVAVTRHLKNVFGENAILPGTHDKPYQQALNRRILTVADWERLCNDVLLLEQDVSLSQVFGMASPKAQVYISDRSANLQLVQKLAGKVLTVRDTDGTINAKGLKTEEIYPLVAKAIEEALNKA